MGESNGHQTLLLSLNIFLSVVVMSAMPAPRRQRQGHFQFKASLWLHSVGCCFVFLGLKVHRLSLHLQNLRQKYMWVITAT